MFTATPLTCNCVSSMLKERYGQLKAEALSGGFYVSAVQQFNNLWRPATAELGG